PRLLRGHGTEDPAALLRRRGRLVEAGLELDERGGALLRLRPHGHGVLRKDLRLRPGGRIPHSPPSLARSQVARKIPRRVRCTAGSKSFQVIVSSVGETTFHSARFGWHQAD